RGDAAARREDAVELLELADPDRGADVVEPVVEAEPRVVEPAAPVRPALVAEGGEEAPLVFRMGGDHAALAGRHLLVRVEGAHRGRSMRSDRITLVAGAERLTGVVDQRDPVPVADRLQLVELARVAVDVHGDDRPRSGRDRRLYGGGLEVERPRVDVGEDRP